MNRSRMKAARALEQSERAQVLKPDIRARKTSADRRLASSSRGKASGVASGAVGLGLRLGRIVGWQGDGEPLVDYQGIPGPGPVVAQSLISLRTEAAAGSGALGSIGENVLVAVTDARSMRPIIVGLVQAGERLPSPSATPGVTAAKGRPLTVEATVDGKRVVIQGEDEIVLRCGQASITLRRNGRVVVRGTYVETRSTGVNRIRGGTVEIN